MKKEYESELEVGKSSHIDYNRINKLYKKYKHSLKYIMILIIICIAGVIYCVSHYASNGNDTSDKYVLDDDSGDSGDLLESSSVVVSGGLGSPTDSSSDTGSGKDSSAASSVSDTGGGLDGSDSSVSSDTGNSQDADSTSKEILYYIYICGQVNNPGVYTCTEGTRYYEIVELAGGFLPNANETALNLAGVVSDGEMIYVPAQGEDATVSVVTSSQSADAGTTSNGDANTGTSSAMVNINTATKEQLMLLPGIGEAKALEIIAYRQANGNFQSIEDIMNVSGIKEAAYAKLKDYITV